MGRTETSGAEGEAFRAKAWGSVSDVPSGPGRVLSGWLQFLAPYSYPSLQEKGYSKLKEGSPCSDKLNHTDQFSSVSVPDAPFSLNQCGSLLYYLTLASAGGSLGLGTTILRMEGMSQHLVAMSEGLVPYLKSLLGSRVV